MHSSRNQLELPERDPIRGACASVSHRRWNMDWIMLFTQRTRSTRPGKRGETATGAGPDHGARPTPRASRFCIHARLATSLLFLMACVFTAPAHAVPGDLVALLSADSEFNRALLMQLENDIPGQLIRVELSGDFRRALARGRELASRDSGRFIALGQLAARVARQTLDGRQVVFSQVPEPTELGLPQPWMRGVSDVPALDKQFALWKRVDPELRRIAMFTGSAQSHLAARARKAATANSLELRVETAQYTRQLLSALKHMQPRPHGVWLAPGQRFLGEDNARRLIGWCARHGISVLTFDPGWLRHGALLSVTPTAAETARMISALLNAPRVPRSGNESIREPRVLKATLNVRAAKQLGLTPSDKLLAGIDLYSED